METITLHRTDHSDTDNPKYMHMYNIGYEWRDLRDGDVADCGNVFRSHIDRANATELCPTCKRYADAANN